MPGPLCTPLYTAEGVVCLLCEATSSDDADDKCAFTEEDVDGEGS